MVRGPEVVVVIPQAIGTRRWTHAGSVVYAMRAAARNHLRTIAFPHVASHRERPIRAALRDAMGW